MIEVDVNGVIHEFPDGTDQGTIRSALQKKYSAPQATSLPEQAVNLGLTYAQGRSFGMGTKPMSAIGATMAYPIVAGAKAIQGQQIPSWSDLYKIPVQDIQSRVAQSREDNPLLSAGAEIIGGIKTGAKFGKPNGGNSASGAKNFAPPQSGKDFAVQLAKKSALGGLVGEAAYRGYEAGTAPIGEEAGILLQPNPTIGGMFGAATPLLSAGVGGAVNAVKKSYGPNIEGASKEAAKTLNALAKKHGIDLSVSNIAGSPRYKRMIEQGKSLPFSGAIDATDKTKTQVYRAITKTMGEESDRITPEYLEGVRKTLGAKFENFTKGKEFSVTPDAYTKIDDIANIASRKGYGAEGEALVKQYQDELSSLIDERGLIKGDKLDKFRRDLSLVARKQSHSDIGQVASDFEDAVVGIISDSDPAISKAISDAKYKYKNYKVVINPAARDQATGEMSIPALSNAVQRVYGVDKFATGRAGDLGEIARVGQALRLPSSSGTAENIAAQRGLLDNLIRTPQYVGNAMLQAYNRNPKNVEAILNKNQNIQVPQSILRKSGTVGMLSGYAGD